MNFREAMSNFRGHREPHLRIIERKRFWFILSGFFVVLSVVGLAVRGLNFSIDFNGGSLLKYPCPNCAKGSLTADDVRSTLTKFGFSDAEVQVVNGDTLTVRTASLTTLGSRAATVLTLPNTAGISAEEVRGTLAQYGRAEAAVSATPNTIRVRSQPLSRQLHGIVLTYDNSANNVTLDDIRTKLQSLGYPGAEPLVFGTTVVILFESLPQHPKAAPSPSPSAGGSPTPGATPSASPLPTEKGRDDVIAALASQAGVNTADVTTTNLRDVTESEIVSAIAQQAGVSASDVRIREISGREQEKLLDTLSAEAGTTSAQINRQDVGPTWGAQISNKAIKGLIIFLILVTLYIAMRFEWKMAAAAQTALLHDIIITAGIYALVGRVVTPATVIAILTILGYSLYDTVVIFDKVKENTESLAMVTRDTYSGVVNTSLNQVLMRSVNTSLVVLLPILSLLLFGGETLKDFAFALFVGVASGTYSSIFVASPVLALVKEREPKYRQIRIRALSRAAHRPQLQAVPAGDGGAREEPAEREAPGRPAPRVDGARPKKKRKTTAAQRRRR